MLPFLKRNQKSMSSGVIVQNRAPDAKPEGQEPEASDTDAIMDCAKDLITAVHAHDAKGVAEAMKAAFDILETLPHDEVEHNDFQSRNEAAAQED